jgi:hypothetical protein
MKRLAISVCALLLMAQAATLSAQPSQTQESPFTLTLLRGLPGPQSKKDVQIVVVRMTNISKEPIKEGVCLTFDGFYKLSVSYNGAQIGDKKERKCSGEVYMMNIDPGRSFEDEILYDPAKPGTYEFMVERRAFPQDANSVVVKSNTLSVEVPESDKTVLSGAIFNLALSVSGHVSFQPSVLDLVITLTNTSTNVMYFDSPCGAFGGLFKVDVALNGVPMDEPELARKKREGYEGGESKGGFCSGSDPGRRAAPGESLEYHLYWDAKEIGTYDFAVERKTFPHDLANSVTIKSNTVSLVMPQPAAKKDQ